MKRKEAVEMEKQFAIFDMDGTLVDSMGYWQELGREYLVSKGVTEGMEEVLDRMKPMTMIESGALFIEAFGLPGTPESVAKEITDVMAEHYRTDVPMKGLRDYFEFLLSCETIGKGKNQPDVYLAAMEKLGATMDNVKIYEDAKYAVRTAKKAGFHVVGIYDRNSVPYWDEICEMADEVILDWEKGIEPI